MPLNDKQEKKVRDATPMDDLTIRLMLRDNPKLAELICRIILKNNDLKVQRVRTQYDASRGGIARGVTMDAVADADMNRVCNLEIQTDVRGLSPERGRYHGSILDVEYLNAGDDFSELPETYIIFICDHDPYGKGEPVYMVDRVIRTRDQEIIREYNDRQHIIYVNGDWKGDDALGKLMHDFHCAKPDEMYYPLMASRLRYFKETEVGRMELTGLAADFFQDGFQDGFQEGENKTQRKNVKRMLDQKWSEVQIATALEMPLDVVHEIATEDVITIS